MNDVTVTWEQIQIALMVIGGLFMLIFTFIWGRRTGRNKSEREHEAEMIYLKNMTIALQADNEHLEEQNEKLREKRF